MAKRDVELVVRARNEATKAVDSVSDALKRLNDIQNQVVVGAGKASTGLDGLKGSATELKARLDTLKALETVVGQLDRATAAVGRLEAEVTGTQADIAKLTAETQKAAAAALGLRNAASSTTDAIREQKEVIAEVRTDLTATNRELRIAEAANRKLAGAVALQTAPNKELSAEYEQQQVALARLKKQQAELSATLATQVGHLDKLKAELSQTNSALRTAEGAEKRFAAEAARTASALEQQQAAVAQAKGDLATIDGVAKKAAAALGTVAASSAEVQAESKAAAVELDRVTTALKKQNAAVGSGAALGPAAAATANYRAQRQELENLERSYREFQDAASAAGRTLSQTQGATAEQRAQFERLRAATVAAKDAYLQQAQALSQLRGTADSSFAAFNQRVNQLTGETRQAESASKGLLGSLKQVVNEFFRAATASQQLAGGMGRAAASTNGLRGAFSGLYGESRRSLSLLQRVRGEVISLATAYVGLFGAISQLRGVTNTFTSFQAVQQRLGVLLSRNTQDVERELRFLRAESDRLGISFEVLAGQYTKFALAAQQNGFDLGATREIFVSLAEAGRVIGLNGDEMTRIFNAFTQIVNKGKVSAEELNQQLGEALPAAMGLFATALGVTTAELAKMMQQGEVFSTESNLLLVGQRLQEVYGAQLPDALDTTAAKIGRFQNAIYNAQLAVANGGFIDALNDALEELNTFFDSTQGKSFFADLGAAAGKLIQVLVVLLDNFDLLVKAGIAFVAIKLLPSFTSLFAALKTGAVLFGTVTGLMKTNTAETVVLTGAQRVFAATTTAVTARIDVLRASLVATAGASVAARAGLASLSFVLSGVRSLVIGVSAAFRGLWAAIGGLPGLILTGVTLALSGWLTSTDDLNDALTEHQRIMEIVRGQYNDIKDLATGWQGAIEGLTLLEAQNSLDKLKAKLDETWESLERLSEAPGRIVIGRQNVTDVRALIDIVTQARAAGTGLDDLKQQISDFSQSAGGMGRAIATELIEVINNAEGVEDSIAEATVVVEGFTRPLEEAEAGVVAFNGVIADVPPVVVEATDELGNMRAAIRSLKEMIPEFADELEREDAFGKLGEALVEAGISLDAFKLNFQGLFGLGEGLGPLLAKLAQLAPLIAAAVGEINRVDVDALAASIQVPGGGGMQTAFDLIRRREGFSATPYNDPRTDANGNQIGPDILRAGFGSNTFTDANGNVHVVVEGTVVTEDDATRDLVRRIAEFQTTVIRQIGADRFGAFSEQQQAVLTSIAYNYGSLPERIVDEVRSGSAEEIANAIRGLAGDNGGVNRGRRNEEADLFIAGHNRELILANDEIIADQEEIAQQTRDRIEAQQFEISQQELLNAGRERQAAIEEALREAREENANITQEELDLIAQQTGQLFDLANAERLREERKEAAMERVNTLLNQQKEIEDSIELLKQRGDAESLSQVAALEAELATVKTDLAEAVTSAMAMAEALGDEAMVANLRNVGLALRDASQNAQFLGLSVQQVGQLGQSFVSGFVGFIDQAAASIAEAVKGTITWKEAIGQVWDSFRQFAANFLLEIAKMIIQQAIMNALQKAFGGGGGVMGAFVSAFHTGGIAGKGRSGRRQVAPSWFDGAVRMHTGGIAGIKPGEVPAILRVGEEVLTENDPRHMANGGGGISQQAPKVKIINTFDPSEVMSAALGTEEGEKVLLNFVRMNARGMNAALQGG